MPTAIAHIEPVYLSNNSPVAFRWRRMLVLYVTIPALLVGSSYAFAQIALVPKIVMGDTPTENSYAATTLLLTQLKVTRGAYALGTVVQPYLRVPGTLIGIDNDNIQVFEYVSPQAAASQARSMFTKEAALTRREFFHAYVKGSLVVLYLGNKSEVVNDLNGLLGAQWRSAAGSQR